MKQRPCKNCTDSDLDDPEAMCIYPHYGLAPHRHDFAKTGSFIGSTVMLPPTEFPANFVPDYEDGDDKTKPIPGLCGTYTHCLHCGAGSQ